LLCARYHDGYGGKENDRRGVHNRLSLEGIFAKHSPFVSGKLRPERRGNLFSIT
jgi:hypothetical protein